MFMIEAPRRPPPPQRTGMASAKLLLPGRMVTFLAMLGQIQARDLNLRRDPQSKDGLNKVGDKGRPHNSQAKSNTDGLKLFDPKAAVRHEFGEAVSRGRIGRVQLVADVRQVVDEIGVGLGAGEEAGQERPQSTANGMHAEGVQRVVVARRRLQLPASQVW